MMKLTRKVAAVKTSRKATTISKTRARPLSGPLARLCVSSIFSLTNKPLPVPGRGAVGIAPAWTLYCTPYNLMPRKRTRDLPLKMRSSTSTAAARASMRTRVTPKPVLGSRTTG